MRGRESENSHELSAGSASYLLLRGEDVSEKNLDTLLSIILESYKDAIQQFGMTTWTKERFKKSLERYRNVFLYGRNALNPDGIFLLSDPVAVDGVNYAKFGGLGFAAGIKSEEKRTMISRWLSDVDERIPHTSVWAEVPTEPNPVATVLVKNGFAYLNNQNEVEKLLNAFDVKEHTYVPDGSHVVYSVPRHGYLQSIIFKQPGRLRQRN